MNDLYNEAIENETQTINTLEQFRELVDRHSMTVIRQEDTYVGMHPHQDFPIAQWYIDREDGLLVLSGSLAV